MANTSSPGNNFMTNEIFHTPCFGDEDFVITSLPSGTDNLTHIHPTISDSLIGSGSIHSHQPSHISYNNSVMSSPDSNSNGSDMRPQFPPENIEMPDISMSNSLTSAGMMAPPLQSFSNNNGAVTTCSVSQNNKTSIHRESSEESSDDSLPLAQLAFMKRQEAAAAAVEAQKQKKTRKAKVTKKKKKKDPNEPQKPVSAYALFFRDTQAAIKGQNPNASFGEVSKIVAQMWDGLDPEHKNVYKKKTENAKKEYLKQLAAYRASLVSQNALDELMPDKRNMRMNISPMHHMSPTNLSPQHNMSPQHMGMSPSHSNASSHSNSMSPPSVNMSPHHISPQNINMSPQHMNVSPQHVNMSPQHVNMSPQQQQVNMSPLDNMVMMSDMSGQNGMGYQSALPKLVPNIQPRSPVLGTLMEEANSETNIMASMCVRNGCVNRSIDHSGWDNEYCSTDCVVSHCRDVFTAWVANRQGMNIDSKVK